VGYTCVQAVEVEGWELGRQRWDVILGSESGLGGSPIFRSTFVSRIHIKPSFTALSYSYPRHDRPALPASRVWTRRSDKQPGPKNV
jgi:hypothetical protein